MLGVWKRKSDLRFIILTDVVVVVLIGFVVLIG